jgi:hypothetical protein
MENIAFDQKSEATLAYLDARTDRDAGNAVAIAHKIVGYGGALTQVDRNRDEDVFGPSIDTHILTLLRKKDV